MSIQETGDALRAHVAECGCHQGTCEAGTELFEAFVAAATLHIEARLAEVGLTALKDSTEEPR